MILLILILNSFDSVGFKSGNFILLSSIIIVYVDNFTFFIFIISLSVNFILLS